MCAASLADVFVYAGLAAPPGARIPQEVEQYRRPHDSPFFLSDFLGRYQDAPGRAGEVEGMSLRDKLALLKHDRCVDAVARRPNLQAPYTYVPPGTPVYKEVRLDLEHSGNPLTAVDVLAYDGERCYLWGVVAYSNPGTVRRDERSVTEACKYLYYNFAIDSVLFVADGSYAMADCRPEDIRSRLLPRPPLDPGHRGILRGKRHARR